MVVAAHAGAARSVVGPRAGPGSVDALAVRPVPRNARPSGCRSVVRRLRHQRAPVLRSSPYGEHRRSCASTSSRRNAPTESARSSAGPSRVSSPTKYRARLRGLASENPTQPKPRFRCVVRDVVQTRGADLREGCHPHVDANTACLSDPGTAAGGRSNGSRRRRDQFLEGCSVVVHCEPPGTPPDPRCRRAVQTCVKGVTPRGEACTTRVAVRSTRTAAEAPRRASKIRARPASRAGSARRARATRTPGARRCVVSRVAFAGARRA